jgi:hypothetical protein
MHWISDLLEVAHLEAEEYHETPRIATHFFLKGRQSFLNHCDQRSYFSLPLVLKLFCEEQEVTCGLFQDRSHFFENDSPMLSAYFHVRLQDLRPTNDSVHTNICQSACFVGASSRKRKFRTVSTAPIGISGASSRPSSSSSTSRSLNCAAGSGTASSRLRNFTPRPGTSSTGGGAG